MWRLLGLKPINDRHLRKITEISEIRNSFVHYKWKVIDMDDEKFGKHEEPFETALANVEKTVRYLQKLQNQKIFHGRKRSALL